MLTLFPASLRRRVPGSLLAVLAALAVLLSNGFALAAFGNLDPTFDTDGKVTTPIGINYDLASVVAIQPDGKLVVAGSANMGGPTDFALARYNVDGSLDTSFDDDGIVTTRIGAGYAAAYALAIQPDGKLVVAGHASIGGADDFALARYNVDGSLDTSFDDDGIVTTHIGTNSAEAHGLAIQPDGKLVVAGFTFNGNDYDIALARYNADGSLDTSFDGDGKLTTTIGTDYDYAYALAIQPDGKLVVAGYTYIDSSDDFALVRYKSDGSLDTSFDGDGKVTTSFDTATDQAYALAIQPDGKLVVAGYTDDIGGADDFALVRYKSDGSLDTSFDGDGKVTTPIGTSSDEAFALAIQPNGKLAVAGSARIGNNNDFALALYNSDGSLDTSFNGDGKVTTPIGTSHDRAQALAIQGDGKLVLAGYASHSSGSYFALARYQGNSLPTISGIGDQTIDEDSPLNPLSFSVGDAETAPGSLSVSASSSNTTLVPNANIVLGGSGADRTVAITPAANRPGSATITLTVTDLGGATAQSSFDLTVKPVNDAPLVSNLVKSGMEDTLLSFAASDFSAQLSDIEGDSLNAIQVTALPPHGTLKLSGVPVTLNQEIAAANLSGLTFIPDANWNGSTSFGWSGSDGASYAAPALVTITITAVNDTPSFTPGAHQAVKSTAGAQTVVGWAGGFVAGPSDEASQTVLSYSVVSNSAPELFAVAPALDASGALSYTPKPGARGMATLGVVVRDSGGTANNGVDTSTVHTFTIAVGENDTVYLPLALHW